ncbi:MAG: signal peptidase II [Chloroflexota bacterium]
MHTLEQTEAPAPPDTRRWPGKTMAFWGTAVVIVALDQLTKAIVRATLNVGESWPSSDWDIKIKNVTNSGAAFSSLQDQTVFLIAMTFFGLAAIYLYYRNPPFQHWVASVAIGMMLGGAVGNLIDRIRVGKVTDFVDVFGFPKFNVADSSISVGVTVIIIGYLLFAERPGKPPEAHEDTPADG